VSLARHLGTGFIYTQTARGEMGRDGEGRVTTEAKHLLERD